MWIAGRDPEDPVSFSKVQVGYRIALGLTGVAAPGPRINDQRMAQESKCGSAVPNWLAATTKAWFSIARARSSTCQS